MLVHDRGVKPAVPGYGRPEHAVDDLGFQLELSHGLDDALGRAGRGRREQRDARLVGVFGGSGAPPPPSPGARVRIRSACSTAPSVRT